MASRMGELRYAGTAVASCDAPQTLWRLSAISSSAASARRPCAPRPPPSRLPLTALASFAPVLAPWHPFVAAGQLPARHALIDFSRNSEALFWPMRAASGTRHVAEANRWTNKRPRRRAAALGGRGIRSPGCQPVWLPSGCARVAFSPTLLLHVITRFGKLTCVRHRREIHVSRCERIM